MGSTYGQDLSGKGIMSRGNERALKGFTLLEVTVALFIIAVALLAMAKMQSASINAAEYSGRMAVALRMAQDVMEQMQARGPSSWESSTSPQICPGGDPQLGIECPEPSGSRWKAGQVQQDLDGSVGHGLAWSHKREHEGSGSCGDLGG
jgi:prepilin-type N-terminal cleavage/methylation domain-containing protein